MRAVERVRRALAAGREGSGRARERLREANAEEVFAIDRYNRAAEQRDPRAMAEAFQALDRAYRQQAVAYELARHAGLRSVLRETRWRDPSSGELRGESLIDPTSALPELADNRLGQEWRRYMTALNAPTAGPAGFAELAERRLEISDMARDLAVHLHWLAERSES